MNILFIVKVMILVGALILTKVSIVFGASSYLGVRNYILYISCVFDNKGRICYMDVTEY